MPAYDFPFIGPLLDQSKASKAADFPRLKRVENLRVAKDGMLRKRRGTTQIAAATTDDPLWGPTAPLQGVKVFTHNDQLLVADRKNLWSYSAADDRLENQGDLPTVALSESTVLGHYGSRDVVACTVARITDFTCWVWVARSSTGGQKMSLHVMTVDNVTGAASPATLVKPESLNEYTSASSFLRNVRAVAINDEKIGVFWGDDTDTEESIYYVEIASATAGPFAMGYSPSYNNLTINKLVDDGAIFDNTQWLDVVGHGTGYLIAYRNKAGTVTVTRYNASHSSQATTTISISGTIPKVQLVPDMTTNASVTCAVAIVTTTHIKIALLNNALAVQGTPYNSEYETDPAWELHDVTIDSFAACKYPAQEVGHDGVVIAFNCHEVTTSTRYYMQVHSYVNGEEQPNGVSDELTNTWAVCKPWVSDNGAYVMTKYLGGSANNHYAILRHETESQVNIGYPQWNPELRLLGGQANPFTVYDHGPSTPPADRIIDCGASVAVDGTDVLVPLVMLDRWSGSKGLNDLTASGVVTVLGCNGYRFGLNPRTHFQVAKANGYTYLGGGTVMAYDGRRASELGFWSYPSLEEITITAVNGTGNLVPGSYLYAFVWEWPDYLGNRHQSAYQITDPGDVELEAPNDTFTITLPSSIRQTYKQWRTFGSDACPVSLIIYRSEVGSIVADGTFQSLRVIANESGATSLLHRLEGAGVVSLMPETDRSRYNLSLGTFDDRASDDLCDLESRELIYSSGGANELQNFPPPPSNVICGHDNRLWGASAENPRTVWQTKQFFAGAAPACNPAISTEFPDDVTALVPQDGNLVAFTKGGAVYTVQGSVDNDGATAGYEPPRLLSTEKTCLNTRSIVSAPGIGVFLETTRGIELMPRGGVEVEWIGKVVRDTLATYPVITAGLHVPADSEVLFSVVDSDDAPTAGRVLAYNYESKVWSIRSYQGRAVTSMCLWLGTVVLCLWDEDDGLTLWKEDAGFDDAGGLYVPWSFETYQLTCGPNGLRTQSIGKMHSLWFLQIQGEVYGQERIKIEESTDDGVTWDSPEYVTVKTTETEGAWRQYQTQSRKARGHSFRFTGLQSTVADTEGFAWYGLTLEGAPLKGQLLLPASKGG